MKTCPSISYHMSIFFPIFFIACLQNYRTIRTDQWPRVTHSTALRGLNLGKAETNSARSKGSSTSTEPGTPSWWVVLCWHSVDGIAMLKYGHPWPGSSEVPWNWRFCSPQKSHNIACFGEPGQLLDGNTVVVDSLNAQQVKTRCLRYSSPMKEQTGKAGKPPVDQGNT